MIRFRTGNIVDDRSEALVNTVNTVGVMGKGIALSFKQRFPENYRAYKRAVEDGKVETGKVFPFENPHEYATRWVLNFPTKQHWRNRSKLEWIELGLADLRRQVLALKITSLAVPPLGCGNGGLDWEDVKPLIVNALQGLGGVDVVVYEPSQRYRTPRPSAAKPELTPARALVAAAIHRYESAGLECTLLEAHKLAYFISKQAEELLGSDPLGLEYEAHIYGPYADKLRHLLRAMQGWLVDSSVELPDADPTDVVYTVPTAVCEVDEYMEGPGQPFKPVLDKVFHLVNGFESPLGLELLASLDWLLRETEFDPAATSPRSAISDWPGPPTARSRKSRILNDELLQLGISRLTSETGRSWQRNGS
jgi:O-acetyl-ADP-ribose deacetylase (regulator of RNase III)